MLSGLTTERTHAGRDHMTSCEHILWCLRHFQYGAKADIAEFILCCALENTNNYCTLTCDLVFLLYL